LYHIKLPYGITSLTPWSRVLLKRLTVTQLVKKLNAFYNPGSSWCSQELVTGLYPEPDKSSQHSPTLFVLEAF